MPLRNSKATYDDLVTGEHVEMVKTKPYKGVRGVHTVELFDAKTGRLVKRAKSENFISVVMEEIQRQMALLAFLSDTLNTASSNQTTLTRTLYNAGNGNQDPFVIFAGVQFIAGTPRELPFARLILTDFDGSEDPGSELLIRGNVVGWADRTSAEAGTGALKGQLNTSESYGENGHIHLVFDWLTSGANGTFQSVYFAAAEDRNQVAGIGGYTLQMTPPDGYTFLGSSQQNHVCVLKGTNFYILARNTVTSGYAVLKYTLDTGAKTLSYASAYAEITSGNLPSGYGYAMDIAPNGDVYLMRCDSYGNGQTSKLIVFGTDGVLKNVPGTSNTVLDIGKAYGGGICINGNDLYMLYTRDWGAPFKIARFNTYNLSNVLDLKTIDAATASRTSLGLFYVPGVDQLCAADSNGFLYFVDRSSIAASSNCPLLTSKPTSSAPYLVSYDATRKRYLSIDADGVQSSGGPVQISDIGFIGSRNLLPSPVTKTSANTMKLTYDLYFDSY